MSDPERVGHEAAHLLTLTQAERDEMTAACGVDLLVYLCNGGTVEALQALVREAAEDCDEDCDAYDDSMDGDHDSAMASAGFGTDEDYGCFGGDDW
jgi:hypothetical protein